MYPDEIATPGWRTNLGWCDILLDTQVALAPVTVMPSVLPPVAEDRVYTVAGWTLTAHYKRRANREDAGLLITRLQGPDGWVGAVAMETVSKSRVPWKELRDRFPAVGRLLLPMQASPSRMGMFETGFGCAIASLRAAMTDPTGWGLETATTREARIVVNWAGRGIRHHDAGQRLWTIEGTRPYLLNPVIDAGWPMDDETIDWISEAAVAGWHEKHPTVWSSGPLAGWGELLLLKKRGWTPAEMTEFHNSVEGVVSGNQWKQVLLTRR